MKVCFGIISIGQKYIEEFEKLFQPSVVSYCQKHGYDLKIFTDFLDSAHKHGDTISFQKCLVPSHLLEYDLVVVLDADIYIHSYSPPIHLLDLHNKIGIVNEVGQSSPEAYQSMIQTGFADVGTIYYKKAGLDLETQLILNTGVIVCNPKLHGEFLKSIYEKYIETSIGHPRGFHYEQSCIGYELQTKHMFHLLPNTWNHIYIHSQLTNTPVGSPYFLHLAGIKGPARESILTRHVTKSLFRWGIKK